MKKWHEKNRDLYNYKARLKMREHYRNNEEYRTQSLKDKKEKYYNKKYGMSFEEYTKMKQQEQDDFIKNNKEAFDKLVKKEEQILDSETKQKI